MSMGSVLVIQPTVIEKKKTAPVLNIYTFPKQYNYLHSIYTERDVTDMT